MANDIIKTGFVKLGYNGDIMLLVSSFGVIKVRRYRLVCLYVDEAKGVPTPFAKQKVQNATCYNPYIPM